MTALPGRQLRSLLGARATMSGLVDVVLPVVGGGGLDGVAAADDDSGAGDGVLSTLDGAGAAGGALAER